MSGPEAVHQFMSESDDGLVERPVLLVVQEGDEAGVLGWSAGPAHCGQSRGSIMEISAKRKIRAEALWHLMGGRSSKL